MNLLPILLPLHFFQVESTLYRIHSDILGKHSEIFRTILEMQGEGGIDDVTPLLLEQMETKDFDCLMSWIYDSR